MRRTPAQERKHAEYLKRTDAQREAYKHQQRVAYHKKRLTGWKRGQKYTAAENRARAERLARRRAKLRSRKGDTSGAARREALAFSVVNLAALDHPLYVIAGPSGRHTEIWPPRDQAQAWLDQEPARRGEVSTQVSTTPGHQPATGVGYRHE